MAIAGSAAVPGVTSRRVATIASFWRSCLPSAEQHIEMMRHGNTLLALAALDLTTRAHGAHYCVEAAGITQQWLALAHMLQQTGHAGELATPLSLLVDHFETPAENFLAAMALNRQRYAKAMCGEVHPVKKADCSMRLMLRLILWRCLPASWLAKR